MNPSSKASRVRVRPYVPAELAHRLEKRCAADGISMSAALTSALEEWIDDVGDRTLLRKQMLRMETAHARLRRDTDFHAAAFSAFVRVWFAHTRALPPEQRGEARASADERYREFMQYVGDDFGGGHRFIDDLPEVPVANDAELEAVLSRIETSKAGAV